MPEKDKHRVTVYLTDDNYQIFTSYMSANYSIADSYGIKSEIINNAVSFYCTNSTNMNAPINESIRLDSDQAEWKEIFENLPTRSFFIEGDADAPKPPVGYRSNGPLMPELTVKEDSDPKKPDKKATRIILEKKEKKKECAT